MTLLLSATLTVSLTADAALKVYRLKGNVTRTAASGKSGALTRRETVAKSDMLSIPAGGSVEILDTQTQRLYASVATGKMSVADLMSRADRDAASVTAKTNDKILRAVGDNARERRASFGAAGLSLHQTDAVLNTPEALPPGTSFLSYLMNLDPAVEFEGSNDVVLLRRDYGDGDTSFNFSVFNTLTEPLYVNVIPQQPAYGALTFLFGDNPLVSPRSETLFPQYRFLLPESKTGYIVIASPSPFTLSDAERLLDPDHTPKQDFYLSLLRI